MDNIHESGYDCYHAALHEVCKLFHTNYKPYELFFLNKICYEDVDEGNTNHFTSMEYNPTRVYQNLNKEIFKVELYREVDSATLYNQLSRGFVVLAMIDNRHLKYDTIYHNARIRHHCVVLKDLDEMGNANIIDPFIMINSSKINRYEGKYKVDEIANNCYYILSFEDVKEMKFKNNRLLCAVSNILGYYQNEKNMMNDFAFFGDRVRKLVELDDEKFERECIYISATLESNPNISLFLYMRDLLLSNKGIAIEESNQINYILDMWKKKKMLFQKIGVSRKRDKLNGLIDECLGIINSQLEVLVDINMKLKEVICR